jgi:hypothetical protein
VAARAYRVTPNGYASENGDDYAYRRAATTLPVPPACTSLRMRSVGDAAGAQSDAGAVACAVGAVAVVVGAVERHVSALSTAAQGRTMARQQMTSTCRIFTAGPAVTDPITGAVTHTELNPVTTACRVRPAGTSGNSGGTGQDVGGAESIAAGFVVSLPFAVTPTLFQRLVVTQSPDPSLVGLPLEIRQIARGDNITARRLLCEEVG